MEEWRAVVGFEDYYEVSSYGRVKSVRSGKIARTPPGTKGYLYAYFCVARKRKARAVAIVVAEAFVPRGRADQVEVNHKDFDHLNNRAANLEWVTHAENIEHSRVHGRSSATLMPGKRKKLTPEDVREIRARRARGDRQVDLAREFGVSKGNISLIHRGFIWKEA